MKRKPRVALAAVVVVALLAGLALPAASAPANPPYTIAWINNITGAAGIVQKIPLIMLRAYINRVNAEGGVNGRQIVIQERDVAGDTPKMLVDIRQAAGDSSVLAVMGLGMERPAPRARVRVGLAGPFEPVRRHPKTAFVA